MSNITIKHIKFQSRGTGVVYGAYGIDKYPDWAEPIEKEETWLKISK